MPTKRNANRKKIPYATDAMESAASRGVGSAATDNPDSFRTSFNLPTYSLAQYQPDPEIQISTRQPADTPPADTPMEDSDDDILQPATETDDAEESTLLLTLRKKYKRVHSNLIKVTSHLGFVKECKQNSLTPRGLRVNVKCHALLADLSDVGHKFKLTTTKAETEYLQALLEHYETTTAKLKLEEHQIEAAMEKICNTTKDKKTVELHKELFTKTMTNLGTREKTLETRKRRKLDQMREPPPPRARRPQQRRGMPSYNNKRTPSHNTARAPPNNSRPRTANNAPNTRPPKNNNMHVNPNFTYNEPQAATLLAGLLGQLSRQHPPLPNPPVQQQQPPLQGQATNTLYRQLPTLSGQGFLGWQQPSLSYPGLNGGLLQQNFG